MSSNFMEELNNRVKSSDQGRQFVLPTNISKQYFQSQDFFSYESMSIENQYQIKKTRQ